MFRPKSLNLALWTLGCAAGLGAQQRLPYEVTDLSRRDRVTIVVFGDAGTGEAGQYRVGQAAANMCQRRGCDLGLMLGDNLYEDGVEVRERTDASASLLEIMRQFERKFELPYARLGDDNDGFHMWAVAGNHDYRDNAIWAQVLYSEFSEMWRMPGLSYELPGLPEWLQIYALHTDTDEHRELNGLQVESARRALCHTGDGERWKLAIGHQPVYNSGHHRRNSEERRTRSMLEEPLLRACGVHLYMSGHAHHQEHVTARGFEQLIQGNSGKSKGSNRPVRGDGLRQRHFSRGYGFSIIELTPRMLRIDMYRVPDTDEDGRYVTPEPDELVLEHTWCATREQVGRAGLDRFACPAEIRQR